MLRKKALLIGNYTYPEYHPLQGVDTEVSLILQDILSVQCSENRNMFRLENLGAYDLCISYADSWREPISSVQMGGLLAYTASGGGLLVLHNGISLQSKSEFAQLVGAKFAGHPPARPLELTVAAPEHPAVDGVEPFAIEEEPYRFEFDPFVQRTVLLEYEEDGQKYPAAWAHTYGLGRVVYVMPGHQEGVLKRPEMRRLLYRTAKWAARA
ncbi:ThuA domain-containing protein [Saccharibacillus sp. CPCC 101409]|uniref:ThuA domain-containing protein n=1 Tax=Saccharibacillus sp. CPCC 101409 TaxID=3058041 RepID=UPI002672088A|nr:ThuA domain-containing protein [Saccharibacillus sp. CPCC 101409]MDO3410147.1 ThuA domain-containing protein [Saccharibacillus sp. CPCC 101409]